MELKQCYNKGCGIKYNPEENTDTSCWYHPGDPVFHDALKGWSCCSKRSTDFTEFLNIAGCTFGRHHSSAIPVRPKKEEADISDIKGKFQVMVPKHRKPLPIKPADRPADDEPMKKLEIKVGPSLQNQLDKLQVVAEPALDVDTQDVAMGAKCLNNVCLREYTGPLSKEEGCRHHPGIPVFHEGMKSWSCCNRKTSDFNSFLNQEGCTVGKHYFKNGTVLKKAGPPRVDWHQTGSTVCLSIFAKLADPTRCCFEANRVVLKVQIMFADGSNIFDRVYHLNGAFSEGNVLQVICPEASGVKMLGTKVEVNLKKEEPFKWPALERPSPEPSITDDCPPCTTHVNDATTTDDPSSTSDDRSSTTDDRSSTSDDRSSTADNCPSTADDCPPTADDDVSSIAEGLSTIGGASSVSDD